MKLNPVFLLRRDVGVHWNTGRLCHWRIVGPESAVAVRILTSTPIVGISWSCFSALQVLAGIWLTAHLVADWSCRCANCGFDVACGNCDEVWLVRRSARRDESFPAGISNMEQMDRSPRSDRNRVGSSASPTTAGWASSGRNTTSPGPASRRPATRSKSAEIGWILFAQIRGRYASRLNELASFWMIPPAMWIGARELEAHHPTGPVNPA